VNRPDPQVKGTSRAYIGPLIVTAAILTWSRRDPR
jgi:hypothetical protein